jgi:alpha-tubulin suppressor-like RCC1 family protein
VRVPGLSNIVAISGGFLHAVALKSDGTVWAWGYNYNGQVGNGTFEYTVNPPAQ